MATFNLTAGYAVGAAFYFLAVVPIIVFWARSLQRPAAPIQSPPLRMAHLFLRIAAPVYGLYVPISILTRHPTSMGSNPPIDR